MNDMELLSARLRTLERNFRWMKRAVAIGCCLIVGGGLTAQVAPRVGQVLRAPAEDIQRPAAPVEDEVRAHQITLVDRNGRDRASLVADNAGTVFLIMSDTKGKTRVNLSVANDGPSLQFLDPSGRARTIVGSTTLVGSHVNDKGIAEIAPPSSIVLFDGSGKLLFRTP